MNNELKTALQNLAAISEKDTRMGNGREVLRLFQRIQRGFLGSNQIVCDVEAREIDVRLHLYFYKKNLDINSEVTMHFWYDPTEVYSSYQIKKQFFTRLRNFINEIKACYYEQE